MSTLFLAAGTRWKTKAKSLPSSTVTQRQTPHHQQLIALRAKSQNCRGSSSIQTLKLGATASLKASSCRMWGVSLSTVLWTATPWCGTGTQGNTASSCAITNGVTSGGITVRTCMWTTSIRKGSTRSQLRTCNQAI